MIVHTSITEAELYNLDRLAQQLNAQLTNPFEHGIPRAALLRAMIRLSLSDPEPLIQFVLESEEERHHDTTDHV